ncbi:alkylhydroperoxidase [Polaribacter filamentus]|uniref:Alkylhydroperoxidase n=1 Tax=Polaribacter filamentus TaxID=53483 RepID=A0A2S7KWJ2_9FLAO|nr:carboxymuconolactone decarboxylase family protein [Polaribacter filamentus]PQB06873.1 alkylhydroperoxidase [Polaribacter filamentus]
MKKLNLEPKTSETTNPITSAILDEAKKAMGFVPNMYAGMANNTALLDSYIHSYKTFRQNSGFNSVEQEIIFLSVAYENECDYCMAAHSFVADKASKVPTEITDAIRSNGIINNVKLKALSTFTRIVTKNRGHVTNQEIADLLNVGYDESHVLGVITGVGVKTFSNYFNHIAETPLDDVFKSRVWSRN